MKKEVIIVPKDKSPLDVLAEMGERIRNSWIFIHENAYEYLLKSKGVRHSTGNMMNANQRTFMKWEATEEHAEIFVFCEVPNSKGWGKITSIDAENIAFRYCNYDPEDIYFLRMDK